MTKATLSPGAGSPNEPLQFVGGVSLEPGIYSLRFGVVDADGRRGSVVRDVNAWKMAGEPLAMGDLIVGNLPASGQGLRAEVEPYVVDDRLAAYLELYSNAEATWNGATVTFEIADNQDSPALASLPAQLATGRQPTWRVATGVMAAQALPPGRYVARAQITRDGKAVGVLVRPFVLERAAGRADRGAGGGRGGGASRLHRRCRSSTPAARCRASCSRRCSTWSRSDRRRSRTRWSRRAPAGTARRRSRR